MATIIAALAAGTGVAPCRPMTRVAGLAWIVAAGGCVAPSTSLVVELRTDFVAPGEFARVETVVHENELAFEAVQDHPIALTELGPMRIGEFDAVPLAPATITVRLFDAEDRMVAERSVRFAPHAGARAVTVIVSRNCVGIVCPEAQSCLDGACVDERCTPETPEWCDVEVCATAEDCAGATASCEVATCDIGVCRYDTTGCTAPPVDCTSAADCVDPPMACATASCNNGACVYDTDACVECETDAECTPDFDTCAVARCVDNACVTELDDAGCLEWSCVPDSDPSCDPAGVPFGGGDGSVAAPYLICSPDQFNQVRNYRDSNFRLAADIQMGGTDFEPILTIHGVFDGNCHVVRNLWIDYGFGALGKSVFQGLNGATVERVAFENLRAHGNTNNAGLAYRTRNGARIRNVFVQGHVESNNRDAAGLVVWLAEGSTIEDSAFDGVVRATPNFGWRFDGGSYAAGLVLRTDADSSIFRSWARGSVWSESWKVAGLVGDHRGTIEQCVAAMDVTALSRASGLVAEIYGGVVRDSAVLDVTVTADMWASGIVSESHDTAITLERVFSRATPVADSWVHPVCRYCAENSTLTDVIFVADEVTETTRGVGLPRARLFDPADPAFATYASPPWSFVAGRYPVLVPSAAAP